MPNDKEESTIKLWSIILPTTFTLIGSIFGVIKWMDSAYATENDINAKISPIVAEVTVVKNAQDVFTHQIIELRKDQLRGQLRESKKEQYELQQNIDSGKANSNEMKRFRDLGFDIQEIQERLNEIK